MELDEDFSNDFSNEGYSNEELESYLNIGIKFPYAAVSFLQFGVASPTEIIQQSVCEITSTSLKGDLHDTVYDPRMGVLGIGKDEDCETCGQKDACPGHFGHIILGAPVIHPKFFKTIVNIFKCVCYSCSSVYVSKEHANLLGASKYRSIEKLNYMVELCSKVELCPKCGDPRGSCKIKDDKIKLEYVVQKASSKDKKGKKVKTIDLGAKELLDIFVKISNEDYSLLGFNQDLDTDPKYRNVTNLIDQNTTHRHQTRPEWFILTALPVLPIPARPYSIRDGEKHDDDLTDKYISIIKISKKLRDDSLLKNGIGGIDESKKGGLTESEKRKLIKDLEDHTSTLIDNSNETSKVSGGRAHKCLRERISEKDGHMRKNIMGKRVNFSARTVIGGDPTLALDELGTPESIAAKLTKPIFTTSSNISQVQKLVDDHYVNYVFRNNKQIMMSLATKDGTKPFIVKEKDIIERQLLDGDWVLFNRQPTLRIESMMGFKIRRKKYGKTFRFNLSATTPFNADYDGDWFSCLQKVFKPSSVF